MKQAAAKPQLIEERMVVTIAFRQFTDRITSHYCHYLYPVYMPIPCRLCAYSCNLKEHAVEFAWYTYTHLCTHSKEHHNMTMYSTVSYCIHFDHFITVSRSHPILRNTYAVHGIAPSSSWLTSNATTLASLLCAVFQQWIPYFATWQWILFQRSLRACAHHMTFHALPWKHRNFTP